MLDYLRVSCYNKKMAATSDMGVLLKFYAIKQNSPFVSYSDFADYLKRYAQHNIEQLPDLAVYLGNPVPQMDKALEQLENSRQATILDSNPSKKEIFVAGYFNSIFGKRYADLQKNPKDTFPTVQDLPKRTPENLLVKAEYTDLIFELLKKQDGGDRNLYAIVVPMDLPSVVFPGDTPISLLVNVSFQKIHIMLSKAESHDYYLKKLSISNPGKEISVKNFFNQFIKNPEETMQSLRTSSDCYYFWGQLCHFIKKDYEKVKDFTQEDVSILQAIAIAEIVAAFYKNESAKTMQQELALKSVQNQMKQPPFYFTMDAILKFTDAKGVPLQGQYSDEALKQFLEKETTDALKNKLPNLLVFKTASGSRYFIYKEKVFPLVLRMCDELHDSVHDTLKQEWYDTLKEYKTLPEMNDDKAFNARLEKEVEKLSPILYSLLNATFLSVLNMEMSSASSQKENSQSHLFYGDDLLPYATLLMLSRQTILYDAKILLPFWYTIPFFSWIAKLFSKKNNAEKKSKNNAADESETQEESSSKSKSKSKKAALISAAAKLEQSLVPEGSTIERELNLYRKQWNIMITKEASLNLTNDVNSLIRDYTRKIVRSINSKSFTIDRIQNLAETFCKSPSMQQIHDQSSLYMYVQLYMVHLVKNM